MAMLCYTKFWTGFQQRTEGAKRDEEIQLRKISYKKLWKLLIDKDLNKQTLAQTANISASTLTKMSKGASVNTDMLVKICNALDCELHDIVDLEPKWRNNP
jgi:DNA-binding Xre family transcriptional regulator